MGEVLACIHKEKTADHVLHNEKLLAELRGMKLEDLKWRALSMGCEEKAVTDADGEDDPKQSVIDLILAISLLPRPTTLEHVEACDDFWSSDTDVDIRTKLAEPAAKTSTQFDHRKPTLHRLNTLDSFSPSNAEQSQPREASPSQPAHLVAQAKPREDPAKRREEQLAMRSKPLVAMFGQEQQMEEKRWQMSPPRASVFVNRKSIVQCSSAVPLCPAQSDPRDGAEVQVGQHIFHLKSPLGRGSFSTVWSAVSKDGSREVAIKETLCRSPEEVKNAEHESEIIQIASSVAHRIPKFIACETTASATGTSVVRLAMTKAQGESLDTFLSRWKNQRISNLSTHAVERHFVDACDFTRELLLQMVPNFEALSELILHRDVNTHNLLVSAEPGSSNPQFSLIDFGLATEIKKWPALMTTVPVVGDSRYWPTSAWLIFTYGKQKLMEEQSLMMEYMSQLDLHALGISTLQVFFEILQPGSPAAGGNIPQELWMLKRAWDQYWNDAYKLSELLYQAFQNKIDFDSVRRHFINCEAYRVIAKDLVQVRLALVKVCGACTRAEPGTHLFGAGKTFAAILEMISEGSNVKVASWASVRSILDGRQHATLSGSKSGGALGSPTINSIAASSPRFWRSNDGKMPETGTKRSLRVSAPRRASVAKAPEALKVILAEKVVPTRVGSVVTARTVGSFRNGHPQQVRASSLVPFLGWRHP